MIDSIYIGITGVRSHETRLNVISNNVANINTTAFKSGRVNFSDVLSKTLQEGRGAAELVTATNPLQSGLGVQVSTIDTIQQQGTLQNTGIETDLAYRGRRLFHPQRRNRGSVHPRRHVRLRRLGQVFRPRDRPGRPGQPGQCRRQLQVGEGRSDVTVQSRRK